MGRGLVWKGLGTWLDVNKFDSRDRDANVKWQILILGKVVGRLQHTRLMLASAQR